MAELLIPPDYPYLAKQKKLVLANCGVIDPESLAQYEAAGGYQGLRKALRDEPGRGDRGGEEGRAARPRRGGLPHRPEVELRRRGEGREAT